MPRPRRQARNAAPYLGVMSAVTGGRYTRGRSRAKPITDATTIGGAETVADFVARLCEHGNPPRQRKDFCGCPFSYRVTS